MKVTIGTEEQAATQLLGREYSEVFLKPSYFYLKRGETEDMDEHAYLTKGEIPDGSYLIGLEVIAKKIPMRLLHHLKKRFGLVLSDNTLFQIQGDSYILSEFKHELIESYGESYSVTSLT
jgi:hypothetical protein